MSVAIGIHTAVFGWHIISTLRQITPADESDPDKAHSWLLDNTHPKLTFAIFMEYSRVKVSSSLPEDSLRMMGRFSTLSKAVLINCSVHYEESSEGIKILPFSKRD